ncbi:hypothetical protein AVEN_169470-1 [Araneus ventricosus]|uniref:Uncharacterized protein n=1 Tax=Araneus ventricosus TaxID=182803 RepID=A0A4Y2PYH5_ARAVE|nr:hypothetical protein AVEN_169470-1 [Araneus ventricosus]
MRRMTSWSSPALQSQCGRGGTGRYGYLTHGRQPTRKGSNAWQALEQIQTSTFGYSRYLVPTEDAHSLLLTMRRTTSWI